MFEGARLGITGMGEEAAVDRAHVIVRQAEGAERRATLAKGSGMDN